jgi:molybdopterin/thiamine biosynthesis adenylyltransferase
MSITADYTVRNRGIITNWQQCLLDRAVVAIAGCGGDGGQLAETLARMGVCNFRLADPEVFSVENLNRQAGCYRSTLGRNKAEVIAERIRDINPNAAIKVYTEGVTESNLVLFLSGACIVADEIEYTEHHLAVMLARKARLLSIPNVMAMNVAFGCLVTSFHPDSLTVEEFLGINPDAPLDEIASTPVSLDRWIPRLPGYAESDVVAKVASGEIPAPSVAVGVQLAAGYAAFEALNYICRRRKPLAAPEVFWADAQEMSSGVLTIDVPVAS